MNEVIAEELIRTFIQRESPEESTYEKVEIQEFIFLFNRAMHLLKSQQVQEDWLKIRMKEFLKRLNEKIKLAEELYVAYDRNTNYPYVDEEGRVWFFSKEEYAAYVEDYYLQQFVMLTMKKISGEEIKTTLSQLHLFGLPIIVFDIGQYYIEVKRDELLPPTDWSNTPELQIPLTNPNLQRALILFFQTINSRQNTPNKRAILQSLEDRMLDEITKARYLVPTKVLEHHSSTPDEEGAITLSQGDRLQFATLEGNDNNFTWLPVFTDSFEFEKLYNKEQWSSYVGSYDEIVALSSNMTGVVINPHGFGLKIDSNNQANIEKFRSERNEDANSSITTETAVPEETTVLLSEPRELPVQLIESIQAYMKTQKHIHKAFVREKTVGTLKSYLIIVDFEGEKDEIFRGIANVAAPHLNGMTLDLIGMDLWDEEEKDIKPFYKKKRFGFF